MVGVGPCATVRSFPGGGVTRRGNISHSWHQILRNDWTRVRSKFAMLDFIAVVRRCPDCASCNHLSPLRWYFWPALRWCFIGRHLGGVLLACTQGSDVSGRYRTRLSFDALCSEIRLVPGIKLFFVWPLYLWSTRLYDICYVTFTYLLKQLHRIKLFFM